MHGVSIKYESAQHCRIQCVTTVFSFGRAVVEKSQNEEPIRQDNGLYLYHCNHAPVCEYMVHFIERLRSLDSLDNMNRVLENFSVQQVLIDTATSTVLMCTGFLFAVHTQAPQHTIYKLVA